MSLNKSANRRRVSLLAGASLLAGLTAAAFTGLALTPTVAHAYDECAPADAPTTLTDGAGGASDPGLNGATADAFSCSVASYANGIAYSSNGDLTVTKTNTGATVIVADGIRLTGNGSDSVTWNSVIGAITGGATVSSPGPAGALLQVTTATGAISITTTGVNANRVGTTYGLRAISGDAITSTPGGNITFTSTLGANNNVEGGLAAIEAVTNGGNISITNANIQGRQRGVIARTNGAGSVTMALGNAGASTIDGVAAIDLTAGTGGVSITSTGTVSGGTGAAIIATSTGGAVINNTGTIGGSSSGGRVDFSGVSAGGVNFSNTGAGAWLASGASVFTGAADTLTMSGSGANQLLAGASVGFGAGADTFNLSGTLTGGVSTLDFGADADTFAVSGTFTAGAGTVAFGSGADTFNVSGRMAASGTAVTMGSENDTLTVSGTYVATGSTLDFGTGADTLTLSGALRVNGSSTISNLETFNSSGVIYLGGSSGTASDGAFDDRLAVTAGTFTGSGASRIVLDVDLVSEADQIGCATLTAADCVVFTGAATAGSTLLTINDAGLNPSADNGGFNTITLVVGSTAAENFVLDPNSDYYVSTPQGPAVGKEVVAYHLVYDAASQSHLLVGAPTEEVAQAATFAGAAQETWRSTTGSWFSRQADLRATPGGLESSNGVWARMGASLVERDAQATYSLGGGSFDYDLGGTQRISHLMIGADLLRSVGGDSAWVVGGMVGFVRSDADYDTTATESIATGLTGGFYGSYVAGPVFVDAAANLNLLDAQTEIRTIGLPGDVPLAQRIKSLGGQIEAGWRIDLDGGLSVEPLAGVSYVTTKIDDADIAGSANGLDFEDRYTSARVGGGLRVALDTAMARYSLTGRYWNESEGENRTTAVAGATSAALMDDIAGGFGEITGGVSLYSADGAFSGFVNLGGKFGDDYRSAEAAAGLRLRW